MSRLNLTHLWFREGSQGDGLLKRTTNDRQHPEQIIANDGDQVVRRLLERIEETRKIGTLVPMSDDGGDKASWRHRLELFAKKI
jgi:hypothetical protein